MLTQQVMKGGDNKMMVISDFAWMNEGKRL